MKKCTKLAVVVFSMFLAAFLSIGTVCCASPAEQLFNEVNKMREVHGVAPLVWDAELASAAELRAKETAELFSHTRPDGSEWYTAVPGERVWAENLSSCDSLSSTMALWTDGDIHEQNMLDERFVRAATAHYQDRSGRIRWVMLYDFK